MWMESPSEAERYSGWLTSCRNFELHFAELSGEKGTRGRAFEATWRDIEDNPRPAGTLTHG